MKNLRVLTLILICLLFFTGLLNGAQKNVKKSKSRFDLVVGANDGGPDRVKLRYASTDAKAVKRVLEDMGEEPRWIRKPPVFDLVDIRSW